MLVNGVYIEKEDYESLLESSENEFKYLRGMISGLCEAKDAIDIKINQFYKIEDEVRLRIKELKESLSKEK